MAVGRKGSVTEEEIVDYLVNKATKVGKKLKSQSFVWRKKIERDVLEGVGNLDENFSLKSEKKRQREKQAEIETIKKRRQERAITNILRRHSERPSMVSEEEPADQDAAAEAAEAAAAFPTPAPVMEGKGEVQELAALIEEDLIDLIPEASRKPKYFSRVHTGYEWNRYNRIHYDHDNPPPKFVQGYKFDIFYPHLFDKSITPGYAVEKDGDSVDTVIIRFHAGLPYEDIAFRVVNNEWEYSKKKGFRCTFEGGILRLYFNFKRYRYRR